MTSATPDPQQFIDARQGLDAKGVRIGASYIMFAATLQARQLMMRNDTNGLCNMAYSTHPTMSKLHSHGVSLHQVADLVSGLTLDAILEVAGKITVADIPKSADECDSKQTLRSIHQCAERHAPNEEFLVPNGLWPWPWHNRTIQWPLAMAL